jgi:Ca2+-transporting ATPase
MSELELQKKTTEKLLDDQAFPYNPKDLAFICNLDNHFKEDNDSDMIISSRMIVEEFGGIQKICSDLRSDPKHGLRESQAENQSRVTFYGRNGFDPPKIKTIWELIMENFEDTINVILLVAGIVSMIINLIQEGFPQGLIEGVSIVISLLIIITVNSGNNYLSEKRLADLVNLSGKQEVAVYRGHDKETITIDTEELMVGDVIKFESGMKVPADCLVLEGQDIVCDEGELTGESIGIMKQAINEHNFREGGSATMLAKSLISSGTGRAIVIAVGKHTVSGVIEEKTGGNQQTLL